MWGRGTGTRPGTGRRDASTDTAKDNLERGAYKESIEYYEKLEVRYPFGPLAMQGQLDLVYAYYKSDEPASAIAAADRFIKLHPRHPNVDYTYYLKGVIRFAEGSSLLDRFLQQGRVGARCERRVAVVPRIRGAGAAISGKPLRGRFPATDALSEEPPGHA